MDRGNKTKRFGEVGKTSKELQLDVWLGNNLKEYIQVGRGAEIKGHVRTLGAWGWM